jgi:hypothetical protein
MGSELKGANVLQEAETQEFTNRMPEKTIAGFRTHRFSTSFSNTSLRNVSKAGSTPSGMVYSPTEINARRSKSETPSSGNGYPLQVQHSTHPAIHSQGDSVS